MMGVFEEWLKRAKPSALTPDRCDLTDKAWAQLAWLESEHLTERRLGVDRADTVAVPLEPTGVMIDVSAWLTAFRVLSVWSVRGCPALVVENPATCSDFNHLLGKTVTYQSTPHKIIGVERFAHMPPFREGELISLLIEAA